MQGKYLFFLKISVGILVSTIISYEQLKQKYKINFVENWYYVTNNI